MDNHRWGFEEADDWEFEDGDRGQQEDVQQADLITAQDPDGVVTVAVTSAAEPVSVKLSPGWQRLVDPRGLNLNVTAAANTATVNAATSQMDQVSDMSHAQDGGNVVPEMTPLSKEDVLRLVDAVTAAESSGGHVRGMVRGGQVSQLLIETSWAGHVRDAEIESELLDVLKTLQRRSTAGDLASGPKSPAISELTKLVENPEVFVRRLGLIP